jgi:hypothetical protein
VIAQRDLNSIQIGERQVKNAIPVEISHDYRRGEVIQRERRRRFCKRPTDYGFDIRNGSGDGGGGGYSPSPPATAQFFIQSSQSRFIYTLAGMDSGDTAATAARRRRRP